MQNKTVNGWTIKSTESVEKGIFFRCPIQEVFYDAYFDEKDVNFSAWMYVNKIKNPLHRCYERLIGNKRAVQEVANWLKQDDFCGFYANVLCCPIYFRRRCRKLTAENITDDQSPYAKIQSKGYESPYNHVAGYCEKEKTIFTTKQNKRLKPILERGEYKYTYSFIIEKVLKGEAV